MNKSKFIVFFILFMFSFLFFPLTNTINGIGALEVILDLENGYGVELNNFTGELALYKWNKEVHLKIKMFDKVESSQKDGDKYKLKYNDYDVQVYEIDNGMEYDIILSKQPKSNVFYISINSKDLVFSYQAPLNEGVYSEVWTTNATHVLNKNGIIVEYRPIDIVGSYAVYHSSKSDNEYKTGKAFHIFRPKIYDINGDWIWGELKYENSQLIITVNSKWLEKAKYPVTIDPSFGYTEINGTEVYQGDRIYGSNATITVSATADSMTFYGAYMGSKTKLALYLESDYSFVGGTEEKTGGTAIQWNTHDFIDGPSLTADIEYVLCWWANATQGKIYYDTGVTTVLYYEGLEYGEWPNPAGFAEYSDYIFSIYCNYTLTPENQVPTNDSCTITDMDDADNLYAQKKWYTFAYVVTDVDGYEDIDYAEVRLKQAASLRVTFRYDEDTNLFSIETNATEWDLDIGSSSAVESGNSITMAFKFKPQWDATEESNLEVECYVVDDEPESDTDTMQSNYVDVITNLLVSGFICDDDRGSIGQTITFTGIVYYADNPASGSPSNDYPPNAEFTAIHIYNSTNGDMGNDASIVNGAFSVPFSAESTIGIETYNPYIDMADADYSDGEETPTDTFIADRFDCWSITDDTGDQRIDVESTFEIRYKIQYDYDNQEFDGADGGIVGFSWDAGNSWWYNSVTGSSSVQSTNYDETYLSITDAQFGITAKKDIVGIDIVTDRIKVMFITSNNTDPDVDEYVELRVLAMLEYDAHVVGSGDTLNLTDATNPPMTWNATNLRWEVEDVRGTDVEVTFDDIDGNETTYDISEVNMDGNSVIVQWGVGAIRVIDSGLFIIFLIGIPVIILALFRRR